MHRRKSRPTGIWVFYILEKKLLKTRKEPWVLQEGIQDVFDHVPHDYHLGHDVSLVADRMLNSFRPCTSGCSEALSAIVRRTLTVQSRYRSMPSTFFWKSGYSPLCLLFIHPIVLPLLLGAKWLFSSSKPKCGSFSLQKVNKTVNMQTQQEINSAPNFIQSAYILALTTFTSEQWLSGVVKLPVGDDHMLLNGLRNFCVNVLLPNPQVAHQHLMSWKCPKAIKCAQHSSIASPEIAANPWKTSVCIRFQCINAQ